MNSKNRAIARIIDEVRQNGGAASWEWLAYRFADSLSAIGNDKGEFLEACGVGALDVKLATMDVREQQGRFNRQATT